MKILYLPVIILIFFISGCSVLTIKDTRSESEKKIDFLVSNWQLSDAESCLNELSDTKIRDYYTRIINNKKEKITELELIVTDVKNGVCNNNFDVMKKHVENNFINNLKFEELKKYDFSEADMLFGTPEFTKDNASLIIALNYQDTVFYFEIKFKLIKNKWKIVDFYEKG